MEEEVRRGLMWEEEYTSDFVAQYGVLF